MLSRLYRIQVIVTFIIPFNRYVWSRYSYSAYKLLLVGLFVPLSFITCTSILKYANLSKLFWKKTILLVLKNECFWFLFFFNFHFSVWISYCCSKIWLKWCVILHFFDQNRKYNRTLVISANLFWCQ